MQILESVCNFQKNYLNVQLSSLLTHAIDDSPLQTYEQGIDSICIT